MVSSRFHYKQYKKPEAEKNTIEMCQVFLQWLLQAFWQSFSDSKYLLAYCGLYILADGHSVLFCYRRWVSESHWPNVHSESVKYGKYTRICNSSIKTTTKHTCRRSLNILQSILRNMHRKLSEQQITTCELNNLLFLKWCNSQGVCLFLDPYCLVLLPCRQLLSQDCLNHHISFLLLTAAGTER